MENKKEKTAPDVSVGADTEQPIRKNTTSSISENGGNIKSFEELQREMQLRSDRKSTRLNSSHPSSSRMPSSA